MKTGFIGLGNVGGKLAASLLRGGIDLTVRDLDRKAGDSLVGKGATWGDSPAAMAASCDLIVTCLPSPAASAAVMEGEDGVLSAMWPGTIWVEMSTTDADEVRRIGAKVAERGGHAADCPVTGGVHRAASGNIAILAGCEREVFERLLPVLGLMGHEILHCGALGTASTLKVMTNVLATANLVSLCEALAVMQAAGMDLATTYEAIRISSGNSFTHETESKLILSGSRKIDFTMQLVLKDIGLFQAIADRTGVPLDLNPLLIRLFEDGARRYGPNAQSDDIIRRIEEVTGTMVTAPGFPDELVDDLPKAPGHEVVPPSEIR
ncbi:NAD(P)-dependent oxidoreductase [Limibaculum sp. M0105]|uniref:NAD(P)-dependent oxidoreductase n=1 Tax=Thermohalobaculum xanthum TaxID=2753746 RepID=A0A8J7M8G0_9RHOB|nr:NAD(P)-dependent oxidoreductase [Thermohalobaculum xanthum]MBK0399847.1 NAD(P)-dependent oxidoreductase [Thermohalobaculum xanthum]